MNQNTVVTYWIYKSGGRNHMQIQRHLAWSWEWGYKYKMKYIMIEEETLDKSCQGHEFSWYLAEMRKWTLVEK